MEIKLFFKIIIIFIAISVISCKERNVKKNEAKGHIEMSDLSAYETDTDYLILKNKAEKNEKDYLKYWHQADSLHSQITRKMIEKKQK